MLPRIQSAACIVLGIACTSWGFFGRDLRSNVEMPMTDAEQVERTPPTKVRRAVYIVFSAGMVIYGLLSFYHQDR